ncbi:MAG: S-layer homology domain-containing protein [Bacillota bacterium]|nr:S-layer homology domain-containing protein [Bacillota bacterium]
MPARLKAFFCGILAACMAAVFASAKEVYAGDEAAAGLLIAENADAGIFSLTIKSGRRLDLDKVYIAAESVYPHLFSLLYNPGYNTELSLTLQTYEQDMESETVLEAKRVIGEIITPGMTTAERAEAIGRYIADVCEYDEAAAKDAQNAPDEPFTAYGALIDRKAVCSGYSRAYSILCNMANVPCVFISSPSVNHAFNAVSIYGNILYTDVTYEDAYGSAEEGSEETYVLIPAEEMKKDHEWDDGLIRRMVSFMYSDSYYDALKLYDLGLLKGNGSDFGLDRAMTRAEAAVMFVRLLGREAEALEANAGHPFTDVPSWADPYVGYLYQKGLAKGISQTLFGASSLTGFNDFLTFGLRSLGYAEGRDFLWSGAEAFALKTGAAEKRELSSGGNDKFLRSDAVKISLSLLSAGLKDEPGTTLCDLLIENGAVTEKTAEEVGLQ